MHINIHTAPASDIYIYIFFFVLIFIYLFSATAPSADPHVWCFLRVLYVVFTSQQLQLHTVSAAYTHPPSTVHPPTINLLVLVPLVWIAQHSINPESPPPYQYSFWALFITPPPYPPNIVNPIKHHPPSPPTNFPVHFPVVLGQWPRQPPTSSPNLPSTAIPSPTPPWGFLSTGVRQDSQDSQVCLTIIWVELQILECNTFPSPKPHQGLCVLTKIGAYFFSPSQGLKSKS